MPKKGRSGRRKSGRPDICPYLRRVRGRFYCEAKKRLRLKDYEASPVFEPCVMEYETCPYYKAVRRR